ncbi:MAG: hypothetical protein ACKOD0_10170, partial [Actinomycetota bacterium]
MITTFAPSDAVGIPTATVTLPPIRVAEQVDAPTEVVEVGGPGTGDDQLVRLELDADFAGAALDERDLHHGREARAHGHLVDGVVHQQPELVVELAALQLDRLHVRDRAGDAAHEAAGGATRE